MTLANKFLSIAQLYNAAKKGNSHLIQKLLANGTPCDTPNIFGVTPLSIAAAYGHQMVVNMLLQTNSVDVNSMSVDARPPIFSAAASGHVDIVRLLLQANADFRVSDVNGDTPYSMAEKLGHRAIVKLMRDVDICRRL